MSKFAEFLKDKDEHIQNAAAILTELTEAYELKSLSKQDYDELVSDVLDMEKIDALCDSIEQKAKVRKAFEALTSIITAIV